MTASTKRICVLGSSGSIGVNTLAVCKHLNIAVDCISAHNQVDLLIKQAIEHNVKHAVISNPDHYQTLKEGLAHTEITVSAGPQALNEIAANPEVDTVVTAIVGAAGLASTLAACGAGKRVCIANKEPLVIAGSLVKECARHHNAQLIPIDSEHSAIFQCLGQHNISEVRKIMLTGSGGPLRALNELESVSKEQALKHPNWSMGEKITIDSATLMNKGLELIEAHHLFNVAAEDIEILIHPESIIHSMVCFNDASVIAQLGLPDMRVPIQFALTYPQHVANDIDAPSFEQLQSLHFEAVKHELFPSINFARQSLQLGALGPCSLNAANECAVDSFLKGKHRFVDIFKTIESALSRVPFCEHASLEDLLACDHDIRNTLQS